MDDSDNDTNEEAGGDGGDGSDGSDEVNQAGVARGPGRNQSPPKAISEQGG